MPQEVLGNQSTGMPASPTTMTSTRILILKHPRCQLVLSIASIHAPRGADSGDEPSSLIKIEVKTPEKALHPFVMRANLSIGAHRTGNPSQVDFSACDVLFKTTRSSSSQELSTAQ